MTRNSDQYFQYAETSLEMEKALHQESGQISSRLAVAYTHMGIAYNMNSIYGEAIPYLEKSIEVRRSLPGFKEDWLFSPLYQLAHAHLHLGNLTEAARILEVAIQDRIEGLGENDRYSMR